MRRKILTILFALSMVGGFLLILGTAGSCDLNLIDFKTTLIQIGIGAALMCGGFKGLKFTNPIYFN